MIASNVSADTLLAAAEEVGVRAEINTKSSTGRRHGLKIYPGEVPDSGWAVSRWPRLCPICGVKVKFHGVTITGNIVGSCGDASPAKRWASFRRKKGKAGDTRYQRVSASVMFHEGARVHAVCWHGFRDYFRAVYRREPGAIFRTAMATWRGSEHFEANYRASGHRNVGSQAAPVCAAEVCRCGEEGMAR